ncbi:DUF1488 domain-containing protein [Aestuariicella sp. G3-2]|uniref:DUF1488 family protein n=1 Tax=Pseudomaricurvus albidus TaxID=2842452 RepID=UPI001C0CEB05|nr:DUF1488 family protein [Aestuariicella albida]MBU3068280.1 DUF1488 domain-containing protein [Aestuariicella albida]
MYAYNPDFNGVSFRIKVLGRNCRCVITAEALQDHYEAEGDSKEALESAFAENGEEIMTIAESMAHEGIEYDAELPFIIYSSDLD